MSLLSHDQSLKCGLSLKFPSHVSMGVLKLASLEMSLMKTFCFSYCLSQVVTKFDSVVTGSSPNESEDIHSPNVPMFSLRSEVIYEKCSSENLPQEVSIKEVEKEEKSPPEFNNEENFIPISSRLFENQPYKICSHSNERKGEKERARRRKRR